ncbi:hypothetical protein L596_002399 [Steinernema carpocapsae]|uniref:EF-hand domain-containing protein n=1 Tax=Steinernema carpocapsae TaxID=34508 RepID=A0A4U8UP27_STECR|nr:hypothetical protein L596_002399 [Steinernema carpocapsae]
MSYQHTKEQISLYQEEFNKRASKKGTISDRQLRRIMIKFGQNPSDANLMDYMGEKKKITFTEFISIMAPIDREIDSNDGLLQLFKKLNRNGTGVISATELRSELTQNGKKLTSKEVDALFKKAGIVENGHVNEEQIMAMMTD